MCFISQPLSAVFYYITRFPFTAVTAAMSASSRNPSPRLGPISNQQQKKSEKRKKNTTTVVLVLRASTACDTRITIHMWNVWNFGTSENRKIRNKRKVDLISVTPFGAGTREPTIPQADVPDELCICICRDEWMENDWCHPCWLVSINCWHIRKISRQICKNALNLLTHTWYDPNRVRSINSHPYNLYVCKKNKNG